MEGETKRIPTHGFVIKAGRLIYLMSFELTQTVEIIKDR